MSAQRAFSFPETWVIRIRGRGTHEFSGSEEDAERCRRPPGRWDQSSSLKWRKNLSRRSDRIAAQIAALFDAGKSVPQTLFDEHRRALYEGD